MMGEAYAEMCVQAGMTLEYGQTLVNSILSPMGVVTSAATIAGGLVGGFPVQGVLEALCQAA